MVDREVHMSPYVSKHQKTFVVEFWNTKGMQEHYTSIQIIQTRTATEKVVTVIFEGDGVYASSANISIGDIFPMRP